MALFYLRKTSWRSGQSSALGTIGFHLAGIRLLFFFFFLLVSVSIALDPLLKARLWPRGQVAFSYLLVSLSQILPEVPEEG